MPRWGADDSDLHAFIVDRYDEARERQATKQRRIARWMGVLLDVPSPDDEPTQEKP